MLASPSPLAVAQRVGSSITLRIVSGAHKGEEFVFDAHQSLVVGRAADVQWRMGKDPFFSRYHFRVEANPPDCWLVDLGSRNGIKVNGKRVQNANLKKGDRIECGETVFEVSVVVAAEEAAAATRRLPAARKSASETIEIASPLPHPKRVGSYELGRELGRGTMGVVYHAVHQPSGRQAAVKLIQPGTAARSEAMQLFLREIVLLGQLRHPRIIEYFGHGLHERRMYLAMEYVPAVDIRDILKTQSPPKRVRLVCGIMCRVLEALQYAHEREVVHRDIKPSNILVYKKSGRLQVKLGDFGLAKNYLNAGLSSISRDNEIRGTLNYMAPEQLIDCRYAKPAGDIYASGVCLYWLLSGKLPFDEDEATNAVALMLNSPAKPLNERGAKLAPELVAVIDQAMARKPNERFPSADEMRRALFPFS